MIAAEELGAELDIVRYPRWRKGDEEVIDLGGDYGGEDVLIVEDKDGRTMRQVEAYLDEQGIASRDSRSVIE
ncbi:MAG: phosphoribosyltransferase [Candidatus Nanohaloarchaea archaeon]